MAQLIAVSLGSLEVELSSYIANSKIHELWEITPHTVEQLVKISSTSLLKNLCR